MLCNKFHLDEERKKQDTRIMMNPTLVELEEELDEVDCALQPSDKWKVMHNISLKNI